MHDVQTDSTTMLQMTEVTYNVTLPDEMFDPKQLRTTVASPVWQPYRAPVQKGTATAQAPDK